MKSERSPILVIALWFGAVTGLLEAGAYLLFQKLGWSNASMWRLPVSPEIFWIAAVFDTALYLAVGVCLDGILRLFPSWPRERFAVFLFSAMTFVIFLQFPGKLHMAAVAILALGLATTCARAVPQTPRTPPFWRRSLPWVLGLVMLACAVVQGGLWAREWTTLRSLPPPAAGAPNILLIVVDTLRADHLSAYGYPRSTSPHFDQFARESVWFENAIATSSWTLPSHASMLTGRDPHEHGAETRALDERYPTIGEALQHKGYRTAAFSANQYWFARREGFDRGFVRFGDYFFDAHSMAVRPYYGRVIDELARRTTGNLNLPARKTAPDVNAEALRWIDRGAGRPFFVVMNYFDVHKPYLPPEPYLTKFAASAEAFHKTTMFDDPDFTKMTPAQLQRDIDAYDGAISYVDDAFGRLIDELRASGVLANTIVVVTSDHGESFGEHGMYTHRNALYLEGIRVPLFVSWPGHVPSGARFTQPVSLTSLPSTLLDLLGDAGQTTFPRPSLTGDWNARSPAGREDGALSELAYQPDEPFAGHPVVHGSMKSLVTSRWHYIVHDKFGEQLYDWRNDPGELQDLIATPEGRQVADTFAQELKRLMSGASKPGG